jgi:hypothetical protein
MDFREILAFTSVFIFIGSIIYIAIDAIRRTNKS